MSTTPTAPPHADLVIIDYQELTNNDSASALLSKVEQAFGPDGTGLIGIRGVPGFVEAKQALLPLSYPLAHLDADDLKELEDPASLYNAGWSHGKEKLKSDQPDLAKGSFYFNPVVDVPGTQEDRDKYPVSYPKNRWCVQYWDSTPSHYVWGFSYTDFSIDIRF